MNKKTEKKFKLDSAKIRRILAFSAVGFFTFYLIILSFFLKEIESMQFTQPSRIDQELERDLREMLRGYPMEEMVPFLAEKDRKVAALMVGIGKKESNWGKHVPVRNGRDCYNYWGYRGKSREMGSEGHTCFRNPQQAVSIVSRRIDELVHQNLDTPEKIIVWKCGRSCVGHSRYSVRKWINDVGYYYDKVINKQLSKKNE